MAWAVEHPTDPVPTGSQGPSFSANAGGGQRGFEERKVVRYGLRQLDREWSSQTLAREDGMLDPDEGMRNAEMLEPELEQEAGAHGGSPRDRQRSPTTRENGAELPASPEIGRRTPIGAFTAVVEPPPHARFAEVMGDARRYVGMIRSGARDITVGAFKLARLPVDIALVAAQKVRPLKA